MRRQVDPWWRKARLAARLLRKKERGQWNARDRALAARLADDPGVSNRLIDQATHCLKASARHDY